MTFLRGLGRIRVRLLVVNLVVLLVPIAGLEFARIHERQLLESLERDMRNQASLVRSFVEQRLWQQRLAECKHARPYTCDLDLRVEYDPSIEVVLASAAQRTRTRIRLLDREGRVVVDSHRHGAPEGPEPAAPSLVGSSSPATRQYGRGQSTPPRDDEPSGFGSDLSGRQEVRDALEGRWSSRTRVREYESPGVMLYHAVPIGEAEGIAGAVYVVRSTTPVLFELYRIRTGLLKVLAVAIVFTLLVTLALALSISRPLTRLSEAAKRIAAGETDVVVPVGGGGEIRELGESIAAMTDELDARARYISQFAADVAHEFKSPLTSIRGAAELLGEGAAEDPAARTRFLRNIELDVERLDRLVVKLLELSRLEASREAMLAFDLEALVRRAAERASTPGVKVEVDWQSDLRILRARETDVLTALLNVLDNAVRFSPDGSVVVRVGRDRDVMSIEVTDRGPGIAPENLGRVFDRFFTTDVERNGTGLGLAIAKTVVEAHGGRALARSKAGEGATITLRLPIRR